MKRKSMQVYPWVDLAEYRSVFCDMSNRHSRMENFTVACSLPTHLAEWNDGLKLLSRTAQEVAPGARFG